MIQYRVYAPEAEKFLEDGKIFQNKEQIINSLVNLYKSSFRSKKYKDIHAWLDQFPTTEEKLNQLLNLGPWELIQGEFKTYEQIITFYTTVQVQATDEDEAEDTIRELLNEGIIKHKAVTIIIGEMERETDVKEASR